MRANGGAPKIPRVRFPHQNTQRCEQMADFTYPLLNNVVFHAFSFISLAASGTALMTHSLRAVEESRRHAKPWRFLLSPVRNQFLFHLAHFAACLVYQATRLVNWHGTPRFQGARVGAYEAFRAPVTFLTYTGTSLMILTFSAIILGLYLRIEGSIRDRGDSLMQVANRGTALVLLLIIALNAGFLATMPPDWFRLRAWTTAASAVVSAFGVFVMGPLALRIWWRVGAGEIKNPQLIRSMRRLLICTIVSVVILTAACPLCGNIDRCLSTVW